MSKPLYRPEEYLEFLKMSKGKHLLVEGSSDVIFFYILFDELLNINWKSRFALDIDTAEQFIEFDSLNIGENRQKVEWVCKNANSNTIGDCTLVGFIDREFDGFEFINEIRDLFLCHKVLAEHLVWSRGHSIENYFFDYNILHDPLRDLSDTDFFVEALELLERFFMSVVQVACAISQTGRELQITQRIKNSIDWNILKITGRGIDVIPAVWKRQLIERMNFTSNQADDILCSYQKWIEITQNSDPVAIRWGTHGHIGTKIIWAAYARCVFNACNECTMDERLKETSRVLMVNEDIRDRSCIGSWVREVHEGRCDFPSPVLSLLGLPT